MAIFGFLETESVVQVNDKTRINASKSFVSKGSSLIDIVKIKPEATESFITVSGTGLSAKDWFLDWQYPTSGTKTIELEITLVGGSIGTFTKEIVVLTEAEDMLLSSDDDLASREADILKWVPAGRNSFLNIHRQAQKNILNWLDEIRIYRRDGTKLRKEDLSLNDDLRELSTFWALALIYGSIWNKQDDSFYKKMKDYASEVEASKRRGRIQADFNGDAVQDISEAKDARSYRLIRR